MHLKKYIQPLLILGVIVIGLYFAITQGIKLYKAHTHVLERQFFYDEYTALSLLIPHGFDVEAGGGNISIQNDDYLIFIIRTIHDADYVPTVHGTTSDDKEKTRRETASYLVSPQELQQGVPEDLTKEDLQALYKEKRFRKVTTEEKQTLDGREIYFGGQNCYHTVSDKDPRVLFDQMELFTSTSKHNSITVCIRSKGNDLSDEEWDHYRNLFDEIVMSMHDLIPVLEKYDFSFENR